MDTRQHRSGITMMGGERSDNNGRHDRQMESRHHGKKSEPDGQQSGNAKRVYVKIKNEYDATVFSDFRLNHREEKRYGHSQKGVPSERRSQEAGEKKSITRQYR